MPQLALSLWVSRQVPEQSVRPEPQVTWQRPAEQIWPAAQRVPHAPQLPLSVWRSRHEPEQSVRPDPHDVVQLPDEQT